MYGRQSAERLGLLAIMVREPPGVSRDCVTSDASYVTFLELLTDCEVQARHSKVVEKRHVLDLACGEILSGKADVILLGAPGVGKTNMAIGMAHEVRCLGNRVQFFNASGLVHEYLEAREECCILRLEARIARANLIVVDELGCLWTTPEPTTTSASSVRRGGLRTMRLDRQRQSAVRRLAQHVRRRREIGGSVD